MARRSDGGRVADATTAAYRSGSVSVLESGFREHVARVSAASVHDERDEMLTFAAFVDCARRLGVDPAKTLVPLAREGPDRFASAFERFVARRDITLEAFGWRIVSLPDGPAYRFAWPVFPPYPRRMRERNDPTLPLAGPPDPWAGTEMPTRRGGPPYHMTEMIEAEPALARRILDRLAAPGGPAGELARLVREAATAQRRIIITGCGTSEHAALGVAEILRDALRSVGLPAKVGSGGAPLAVQAFEAALDEVDREDLVVGVSHEGATWATNRMLDFARGAGARTALITVTDRSPGAALADVVVTTEELDTSWCHTVGYVSPIVAAVAIAGLVRESALDADAISGILDAGLEPGRVARAEELAKVLADRERVVVIGSGADRTAARELTLKIEEGTHLPAAMRDLETLLHGHLAGMDARTGVVLLLTDRRAVEERATRARTALAACREISAAAGAIVSEEVDRLLDDPELTPAGRVVVPVAPALDAPVAALLGTAVPLQLLAERMARARGVDPDPIRRDDPAYRRAAEV